MVSRELLEQAALAALGDVLGTDPVRLVGVRAELEQPRP